MARTSQHFLFIRRWNSNFLVCRTFPKTNTLSDWSMIMWIGKEASANPSNFLIALRTVDNNDIWFSAIGIGINPIDRIPVGMLQLYAYTCSNMCQYCLQLSTVHDVSKWPGPEYVETISISWYEPLLVHSWQMWLKQDVACRTVDQHIKYQCITVVQHIFARVIVVMWRWTLVCWVLLTDPKIIWGRWIYFSLACGFNEIIANVLSISPIRII